MTTWVVGVEDIQTVERLEKEKLLSYKPLFFEQLKVVFIKTDKTKEEIMCIKGITSCREERKGTLFV